MFESQVTFLYTLDLDRTTAFYTNALGLKLALDQGKCRIYRVSRGAYVGFCQRDDLAEAPGWESKVIFTLVTPDVDAWYGRLQAAGIPVEKPPQLNPIYNIYHLFFRDVNGYLIEIQRFEDPAWGQSELE